MYVVLEYGWNVHQRRPIRAFGPFTKAKAFELCKDEPMYAAIELEDES